MYLKQSKLEKIFKIILGLYSLNFSRQVKYCRLEISKKFQKQRSSADLSIYTKISASRTDSGTKINIFFSMEIS